MSKELILRMGAAQDWPMLLHVFNAKSIVLNMTDAKEDKFTLNALEFLKDYIIMHDCEFKISNV